MEFAELVRTRRSVRRYLDKAVSEDMLTTICDAGRWAPSAINMQPWEFIVVTDPEKKTQIGDRAGVAGMKWPHIHAAPALIVLCARKTSQYARDDLMMAAENMMLQAHALGLGTCYIGGFSAGPLRPLLNIPAGLIVPGILTVGYADGEPPMPEKRPLDELIHKDTFHGSGMDFVGSYGRGWRTLIKLIRMRFARRG